MVPSLATTAFPACASPPPFPPDDSPSAPSTRQHATRSLSGEGRDSADVTVRAPAPAGPASSFSPPCSGSGWGWARGNRRAIARGSCGPAYAPPRPPPPSRSVMAGPLLPSPPPLLPAPSDAATCDGDAAPTTFPPSLACWRLNPVPRPSSPSSPSSSLPPTTGRYPGLAVESSWRRSAGRPRVSFSLGRSETMVSMRVKEFRGGS